MPLVRLPATENIFLSKKNEKMDRTEQKIGKMMTLTITNIQNYVASKAVAPTTNIGGNPLVDPLLLSTPLNILMERMRFQKTISCLRLFVQTMDGKFKRKY